MESKQKRLGLLIPSMNVALEPESYAMIPEGYTAHFQRLPFAEASDKYYKMMIESLPEAAQYLAQAGVDAICYGCTTGSLYGGLGFDREVAHEIEKATGVPSTTTSTAVVEALKTLGTKSLAVVTPYPDWLNEKLKAFLQDSGFEVLDLAKISTSGRVGDIEPQQVYETALRTVNVTVDAVFLSCTGLRTMEMLQKLEDKIRRAVVSSNQATIWKLLRIVDTKRSIMGYGGLLEQHLA